MKKLERKETTERILENFLLAYRSTPGTATPGKKSPAKIFLGKKLKTSMKMEKQFNKKHGAKPMEFKAFELVFVKR